MIPEYQTSDLSGGIMISDNQDESATAGEARMEQALRASELSYRRLFEAAKDGILILDADTGRIIDVNPFLFNLLGFSRDEMIGKTVGELSPFKDIEPNKLMLERLQTDGYVRYEDLPMETRDGRKIAVEFVSNVYRAGECDVIQCNIRDITERKATEKERSRLAAIIEYSEDSVVSTTANGVVVGWNHGAERLYAYTAEEMIGRSISILFPPDHHAEYLRILKKIRNGQTVPSFDTVRQRKDGSLINVSVGITPIEARDGAVVGASKISHDIARIKKLEAQFIEAQKMEVIGQLAGGVAHDFNNILAIIMGCGDLIASALGSNSPLQEYAEEIRHASERAAGLTQQLLVFSRKQPVRPAVLDLNDAVKKLDKLLGRLVDENIEMTILPGNELGRVIADSGHVGQVLMNLVVNARDAMPNGGKLTIATSNVTLDENYARAHNGAMSGDFVILSVGDTGTGMSDEVKAHLFEAFFTTKPKGKGTGLGLATCQTIVQQCGGFIGLESEIGAGTTFKIYFPRVERPLDVAPGPIRTGLLPRGTETLLVVEDDPSVRKLARRVLEAQGYAVLSASNGQEGLRVVRDHKGSPIRLVITDVIMPQMGGKVMAEWLETSRPDLKILFTSGYTGASIARHGILEAGMQFLPKPYTLATLAGKVRELLDQSNNPDPAAHSTLVRAPEAQAELL
jgi:two-component system, cell cycle sensor histidine kinase and response regulator CckA